MVEADQGALQKLVDFLTINVTEFFRDAAQWRVLKNRTLPDVLSKNNRLSIWSAGCSHGAEPYSLAIALDELSPGGNYRILGTDLDERILAKARAGGPYTSSDLKNVPRSVLLKYFTPSSEGHMVNTTLLPKITFKRHNLLTDPYERGFDVIVCRNVIIYFSDDAKDKLHRGFFDSLKPGGWLFIGATETMLDATRLGFQRQAASFFQKVPEALLEAKHVGPVVGSAA